MIEIVLGWMDAVGVDITILHPIDPGFGPWAVSRVPERFRSVTSLFEPDGAAVDAASEVAGVVGVRVFLSSKRIDPDGQQLARLERGEYEPVLAACEKHG